MVTMTTVPAIIIIDDDYGDERVDVFMRLVLVEG